MARGLSKVQKTRLRIFGTISVLFVLYFVVSLFSNIYTIFSLTNQKNKLETQYEELQEEAEYLKKDIEKLNDNEYLASYAREKYLYSKDGEYIIQLEEEQKETQEEMDALESLLNTVKNRTYIVVLIIVLFLVYLIFHSKTKKKHKK